MGETSTYSFSLVFSFFQDQFKQHVRADVNPNVYLYYGSDRIRSKTFLSSQDVVITTYNVLSSDFGVSVEADLLVTQSHSLGHDQSWSGGI